MEKLDTNTLVYIIKHIETSIDKEKSFLEQWNSYAEYQERIRTLEDVLKYMKYLHAMSLDISL